MKEVNKKWIQFCKEQAVTIISLVLALASMVLVPVSREYLSYIDYNTISLLFCLMCVTAGLSNRGIFNRLATLLLHHVHTCFGFSTLF